MPLKSVLLMLHSIGQLLNELAGDRRGVGNGGRRVKKKGAQEMEGHRVKKKGAEESFEKEY